MVNYYKILGATRADTTEQIRRKFRELSKQAHPDVGGDNDKYLLILEAYHTLCDEEKRSAYDKRSALLARNILATAKTPQEVQADVYISVEESILGCARELECGKSIVRITIPCGVSNNTALLFKNHNGTGIDITATVHIVTPPNCEVRKYRNRNELIYNLYITKSMLGKQLRIAPLGETLLITIPCGSKGGAMFKIKGKGCNLSDATRADLYVRLNLKG